MADVQPEDGFTRIAHPVLEALARSPIPARHLRVVLAVMRLTWGWGKKSDRLGSSQLASAVDIEPRDARRIVRDLLEWQVLKEVGQSFRGRRVLGLEKDWEQWRIDATRAATVQRRKPPEEGSTYPASNPRGGVNIPRPEEGHTCPAEGGSTYPDSKERKERLIVPRSKNCNTPAEEGSTCPTPEEPDDAVRLAHLLRDEIQRTHPKAKVPTDGKLGVWTQVLERMLRIDHREPAEVEASIRWLFGVNLRNEVSFVVLSPKALREKHDRIVVQMGRRGGVPNDTWSRDG